MWSVYTLCTYQEFLNLCYISSCLAIYFILSRDAALQHTSFTSVVNGICVPVGPVHAEVRFRAPGRALRCALDTLLRSGATSQAHCLFPSTPSMPSTASTPRCRPLLLPLPRASPPL